MPEDTVAVNSKALPDHGEMEIQWIAAIGDPIEWTPVTAWVLDSTALVSKDIYRDPLLYFDRSSATAYYTCKSASVLVYSDTSAAGSAFTKVMERLGPSVVGKHIGQFDEPAKGMVRTIFSKGGSTHLLVGRMIIHLRASCGGSKKEQEQRDRFIRALADHPQFKGGIRMGCGWSSFALVP